MNVATIKYDSIGNFSGISTSLYVSGCGHHCKGCFQPETWNPCYGEEYTKETEDQILNSLKSRYIGSLVLLGGEPLMDYNIETLVGLCQRVREETDGKKIVLFSGFTYEEIIQDKEKMKLLRYVDVLIDGKFIQELYSPALAWRGSSNQRVIDVQAGRKYQQVVLYEM